MTQEEKELLLKDLCARLDTNLVCSIYRTDDEGVGYRDEILHGYCKGDIWYEFYFREDCSIGIDNVSKIKPYLFPLSSMTDEEKEELKQEHIKDEKLYIECLTMAAKGDSSMRGKVIIHYAMDWCNANHFDYRGLIEKGLAIDATGLNVY